MKQLEIRRNQYLKLPEYQVRRRRDWHAVFSTNEIAELWPFIRWGRTPQEERAEFYRIPTILHTIAREYLQIRPQGGRFFINQKGAFYKLDVFGTAVKKQFLRLRIRD
jgi:hypothetical protein